MCSAFILSRLNELNQQLTVIAKLQNMDGETKINSRYKKHDAQNNHRKVCRCAHHGSFFKEQEEYILNHKKKVPCTVETCKAYREVCFCRSARMNEVEQDFQNDAHLLTNEITERRMNNNSSQGEKMRSKSEQTSTDSRVFKNHSDKIITTYAEKDTEIIPTKDTQTQISGSYKTDELLRTLKHETTQTVVDNVNVNAQEFEKAMLDTTAGKNLIERIQKDLFNERQRTKELEEKLKSLTCSIECLQKDGERRAACLKNTLETAEKQAKLANASRNMAMDLVKQTKDQADTVKADRDKLLDESAELQKRLDELVEKNTILTQERDDLKHKLENLSEDDTRRCVEVAEELNRMKSAVKEKEDALCNERKELMQIISELSNLINVQKRRIYEVSSVCNNQQHTIQMKEKELSEKSAELIHVQNALESSYNNCKEMEEKMEHLQDCLCEEAKNCDCLKQEMETLKDSHGSEIRIKEKMIEEQNKTIMKQKKLLRDSEKMTGQVACEFDQLKEELYHEKQRCISLQIALDETDIRLNNTYLVGCQNCRILTTEIEYLSQEKQKALTTAKFAIQKLYHSARGYQKQLINEKQQHQFMNLIIQKKEKEIDYLKTQICQCNARTIRKMNSYVM